MSKPKAPTAPDPYKVADAQAGVNKETIQESAKVNALDQYAPWGSTTYTRDSTGLPTAQTINLSPEGQQFYDTTSGLANVLAGKANDFAGFLPTTPFEAPSDSAGDAVAKALYDRKLGMIQPQLDEADNKIKVQLAERGIPIGSEIYNTEMDRAARNRNDTLAALSQDARLAAGSEYDRQLANALTMRAQPFNEVSAFLQGAPAMQSPSFQSTPAYQMAAPDLAGMIQSNYQSQLSQYNQGQSALSNGLFGLGAAALSLLSDRRAKKDIRRIGKLDNGLPVYAFRYILDDGAMRIGLMADEVEKVVPDAVSMSALGLKVVDYGKVAQRVADGV